MATVDEGMQRQVLDSVAGMIPQFSFKLTPPVIAQKVYRVVYDITGNNDPYLQAKKRSNRLALSLYPGLKEIVASSKDPLLTACKMAIAGNAIDFGPQADYGDLNSIVETSLASPFSIDYYREFKKSVEKASQILYLGDNAGEVVFDRILIEQIRLIKRMDITFVVREKPIINDATMDDALAVGLNEVASIIPNGSDAPATILSQCSPQILELYSSADVIISKGQGNYESLSREQTNIFFLLRAKCPVVAEPLNVNVGDAVLAGKI
jgi:uncharacterized protein with ATP-grasp and redox domains